MDNYFVARIFEKIGKFWEVIIYICFEIVYGSSSLMDSDSWPIQNWTFSELSHSVNQTEY